MPADEPTRSILERAAERLEQLRQSGVALPTDPAARPRGLSYPKGEVSGGLHAAPALRAVRAAEEAKPAALPRAEPLNRVEIDIERLALAGYLSPRADRTTLAEEFRNLKRPLLAKACGASTAVERGNLIMVSSALAGEGKTYAAINLAISMASEFDTSVLLIDADTARPSLLARLGVQASKGLTDLLQDSALTIPDVLLATNIEGLTLLPSGTRHPSATEMLASDAMQRLTTQLASLDSNRIVLFDSPPLLGTSEARVLASLMGQIVVVVEAQKTPVAAVRETLATIETCPHVTLLLNKARQGRSAGGYAGYGY